MKKCKYFEETIDYQAEFINEGDLRLEIDGKSYLFLAPEHIKDEDALLFKSSDGKQFISYLSPDKKSFLLNGERFSFSSEREQNQKKKKKSLGEMISPMPGKILKVMAKEGEVVAEGQAILIMEAMKMEHTIYAAKEGQVEKIFYGEGELVSGGVELVRLAGEG